VAQTVKFLTCVRLVPISDLYRDTDYPECRFFIFLGPAGEWFASVLEWATQSFFQFIIHHYQCYPIPSHDNVVNKLYNNSNNNNSNGWHPRFVLWKNRIQNSTITHPATLCNFLASARYMPVAIHVIRASTKQVTHTFFKSIILQCLEDIEAV